MNTPLRGFLLSLAVALSLAWPHAAVAQGTAASRADRTAGRALSRIELRAGMLSLQARDAPMFDVVSRIAALAGFEAVSIGEISDLPRVTISLSSVALPEALDRILAETNSIVVYAAGSGAKGSPAVSRVLLLGRGASASNASATANSRNGQSPQQREQASTAARVRSESMLRLAQQAGKDSAGGATRDVALDTLSQVLATDAAPIVRVRAAMALGSLGDERGLHALEAATRDSNFSVRAQAITAIGQVPGARSAAVLGGILVDPSANRTERLVAAQALWAHNSDDARQYLSAGAADGDAQVRRASARAPVSAASAAATRANEGPAPTR